MPSPVLFTDEEDAGEEEEGASAPDSGVDPDEEMEYEEDFEDIEEIVEEEVEVEEEEEEEEDDVEEQIEEEVEEVEEEEEDFVDGEEESRRGGEDTGEGCFDDVANESTVNTAIGANAKVTEEEVEEDKRLDVEELIEEEVEVKDEAEEDADEQMAEDIEADDDDVGDEEEEGRTGGEEDVREEVFDDVTNDSAINITIATDANGTHDGNTHSVMASSGELADNHIKDPPVNDVDIRVAKSDTHMAHSEVVSSSEVLVGNSNIEAAWTKTSNNSPCRDFVTVEQAETIHLKRAAGQTVVTQEIGNCESVAVHLEKQLPNLSRELHMHLTDEKLPVTRSRSPSDDLTLETNSKRLAMVCDFYARGWCIKGNSCRFLHIKDGVDNTSSCTSTKAEAEKVTGIEQKVEQPSNSSQLLDIPTAENSSQPLGLQRALVRAYGEEKQLKTQSPTELRIPSFHRDELHVNKKLQEPLTEKGSFPSGTRFWGSSSSVSPHATDSSISRPQKLSESSCSQRLCSPDTFHRSSPLIQGSAQKGSASHNIFSTTTTHYGNHNAFDFDRSHFSQAGSFPQSSLLNYSTLDLKNGRSRNYLEDPLFSLDKRAECYTNDWEPSVRFRSSFYGLSDKVSSPRSQYDPLLDSIEPSDSSMQRLMGQHTNGLVSSSTRSPVHNVCSLPQSNESKNSVWHITEKHIPMASNSGREALDCRENREQPDSGKTRSPTLHVKPGRNLKHEYEKDGQNKELKVLKFFRAALVDFVKELLRPYWRDGNLSKDAHKTIVKKVVEKVVGALHPHQIPSNSEATNHYLSSSRPKLAKLVEGYAIKYSKS